MHNILLIFLRNIYKVRNILIVENERRNFSETFLKGIIFDIRKKLHLICGFLLFNFMIIGILKIININNTVNNTYSRHFQYPLEIV